MHIKPLTLVLTIIFQLCSITAFSQKTAGLNSLLDKNSEFVFPQTTEKISKILHVKTVFYEDANDQKYAKWITKSGLELYCSLGKNDVVNEMFFDIPDDKVLVVENLPYGLALNKSTLQEAKGRFSRYGAQSQTLGKGSMYPDGAQLTFKKGKYYTTLLFDNKNLLRSVGITTELVDPEVN